MDIQLFYQEYGSGFPLILLHGNGGSSDYFSEQFQPLSSVRHVIAPDTRGHGRTPRGNKPFTIRQFAQDLEEFMEELGIDKADLLGFSDGANIAMVFALRYPGRVRKLILDGGNIRPFGVKARYQLRIELACLKTEFAARKNPAVIPKAEMLGIMVHGFTTTPQDLARIRIPTLVIAGTHDMIRKSHTRLIAASIPGASLLFIPGDHGVAAGNPEAFNKAVLDFLE